jgi:hypothetical protein
MRQHLTDLAEAGFLVEVPPADPGENGGDKARNRRHPR